MVLVNGQWEDVQNLQDLQDISEIICRQFSEPLAQRMNGFFVNTDSKADLLKNEVNDLRAEIDELACINDDLQYEISDLENKIDELEVEIEEYKNRITALQEENDELRKTNM